MSAGVTVAVDGQVLKGVKGYSATEESLSPDISDTTGAAGKVTVPLLHAGLDAVSVKRMHRKPIRVVDTLLGAVDGTVRTPSSANGEMSLAADLRLSALTAKRQAAPFGGTLPEYIAYLLSLVGMEDGFEIDPALDEIEVLYIGWYEDVWLMLKALLGVHEVDVSVVNEVIVFRPMRTRIARSSNNIDASWSVDDANIAQAVEGYYYPGEAKTDIAYPPHGWNEDVEVYTVGSRETIVVDIPIEASLVTLGQPQCVDFVGRYDNSLSQYAVSGNDGLPIPAAQWLAAGGSVTVEIGEDTRSIVVTIVGAGIERYAPFSIAMSAGPSDTYSSLRLVGEGVFFRRKYRKWDTSAPPELATQEIGATVDCIFVNSFGLFCDVMAKVRAHWSGPRQNLNVRARQVATPAFEDQTLGNTAGARVPLDGSYYRIRTATITPGEISYTAEGDTIGDDLNAFAEAQGWETIDDFNAAMGDALTFDEFNMAPLTVPEG